VAQRRLFIRVLSRTFLGRYFCERSRHKAARKLGAAVEKSHAHVGANQYRVRQIRAPQIRRYPVTNVAGSPILRTNPGFVQGARPDENDLIGTWSRVGGVVEADSTSRRIDRLIEDQLNRLAADASGWDGCTETLVMDACGN
jgi:hypothetical protein